MSTPEEKARTKNRRSRKWKEKNKDKVSRSNKRYYENNIDAVKNSQAIYYYENKEKIINRQLDYYHKQRYWDDILYKYNLTKEEYKNIYDRQQGLCKICQTDLESFNRRPHVDHCHSTGKVRGILCYACNTGLGNFKDSKELLQKAIEYLTDE